MSYMTPQFSSPVLTMSPQPAHQSLGMANFGHHTLPLFAPCSRQFAQPVRPAAAGRKRSREEASENLEPDIRYLPTEEPEEEWVYGPGMTLIKPSSRYIADAGSQSGTWLEEKKAAEESAIQEARSLTRNPKLQRTGRVARHLSTGSAANGTSAKTDVKSTSSEGPIIDTVTFHLGIGWSKISEEEHIQAAARGWARYIENHYPISNARILLQSKGLQSYLVECGEGFFLFSENLREGKFVSPTVDGALHNLSCTPPQFDSMETLSAAESPRSSVSSASTNDDVEMNID